MISATPIRPKQYKIRRIGTSDGWSAWTDQVPGQNFFLDLEKFDSVEWRDKPVKCTAVAPFEIEEVGRPKCDSSNVSACMSTGTHHFDLEIESDSYYADDCYHSRQITWSALAG